MEYTRDTLKALLQKLRNGENERLLSKAEVETLTNPDGGVVDRTNEWIFAPLLRKTKTRKDIYVPPAGAPPDAAQSLTELEKRERLMDIFSLLIKLGYRGAVDYFATQVATDFARASVFFANARVEYDKERNIYIIRRKGVKGMGNCPKCNGEEIIMAFKQIGSSDEGHTVEFSCGEIGCGHAWKINR